MDSLEESYILRRHMYLYCRKYGPACQNGLKGGIQEWKRRKEYERAGGKVMGQNSKNRIVTGRWERSSTAPRPGSVTRWPKCHNNACAVKIMMLVSMRDGIYDNDIRSKNKRTHVRWCRSSSSNVNGKWASQATTQPPPPEPWVPLSSFVGKPSSSEANANMSMM